MKQKLWRLLDLRDGRGLGFSIELFFLAVLQILSMSSSFDSELELTKVFYTGTLEVITSNWEKSKKSVGTQRILLELLCDLVIRSRGVFSDFSHPPLAYVVQMLLYLVGKMVEGHEGLHPHVNEVMDELEDDDLRNRIDNNLWDQALDAIGLPPSPRLHNHSGLEYRTHTNPTSLSSVHGGTLEHLLSILWGFTGTKVLGGLLFRTQNPRGGRTRLQRVVPRQGNVGGSLAEW